MESSAPLRRGHALRELPNQPRGRPRFGYPYHEETGADAVKLEGGTHLFSTISQFTAQVFPSLVTLVSRPQSVHQLGGYGLQGKEGAAADKLFEEALGLERAGCCAVVLEKVPASVAARVAQSLQIPVIGIGAGSGVDGQVLVSQDMLGMEDRFTPKFLRRFAHSERKSSRQLRRISPQSRSVTSPLMQSPTNSKEITGYEVRSSC